MSIDTWIQLLLSCGLGSLLASGVVLACGRYLRERQTEFQLRYLQRDEPLIFAWLEGRLTRPPELKKTPVLRDFLVRLSGLLEGDLRRGLLTLYSELGYAEADMAALKRRSFQRRVEALQRAASLNFPLPNAAWAVLLRRSGPGWRWAVLELLVHRKGKSALPWLFAFSVDPKDRQKGMWTHLFVAIARRAPDVIPFILAHVDDPFYQQVCLEVLAAYPVPEAGELLRSLANLKAPLAILRACIRALEAHPGAAAMDCLSELATHADEGVRLLVGRALLAWEADEAATILDNLSVDLDYRVREVAVQALGVGGPACFTVLEAIGKDRDHPAHLLAIQQQVALSLTVHGAAA